jgi:hypothetical protein
MTSGCRQPVALQHDQVPLGAQARGLLQVARALRATRCLPLTTAGLLSTVRQFATMMVDRQAASTLHATSRGLHTRMTPAVVTPISIPAATSLMPEAPTRDATFWGLHARMAVAMLDVISAAAAEVLGTENVKT